MTGAAARERLRALADQVDAAYAQMRALSCDEVGSAFRVELAEQLETQQRVNHAHHPEELLHGNTDPPEDDED